MYWANRLLIVLGLILFVVVVTVTLAAPQIIIDLATRLNTTNVAQRGLQVVVALLLDLLAVLVLYRLLRPAPADGLVVRTRGSRTEVSIDSVQRQINARMDEVSDILSVQTEVTAERGNARITMHVRARPDIVIPEKQKEINRVLRQVVEKQLGLRLAGPPAVHIDLVSPAPELAALPVAAPASPSTPPPPTGTVDLEERPAPPPAPRPAEPSEEDLEGPTLPLREEPAERQQAAEPAAEDVAEEPWRAFLLEDDEEQTTPGSG